MVRLDNSLAVSTNVQWGSDFLPEIWQNSQSFLIPNISLSHPEVGGRAGIRVKAQADSATFSPLIVDIIIDKDFIIYETIYDNFIKNLNAEDGTYSQSPFSVWLSIIDHKQEEKARWNFSNCRVSDISEVQVATYTEDENLVITLTIDYDLLTFERKNK